MLTSKVTSHQYQNQYFNDVINIDNVINTLHGYLYSQVISSFNYKVNPHNTTDLVTCGANYISASVVL